MRCPTARRWPRRLRGLPPALLACALVAPAAPAARAGTVVLQNDSIVDFGTAVIQVGFAADERAAAWLTSTCAGNLTAVRVLWLSVNGGAANVLHQAVDVYRAGAFPVPGVRVVEMLGPVMQDGGFNEFQIVPPLPVADGETIVVDFQFLDPPPILGPSVVTDTDGCQPGKNGIYAIPPAAWFSSCALGVTGDFAIRAVVDCGSEPIFADGFESGDTSLWSSTVP